MHLLIVDDNEIILRSLEKILVETGHTVDKARDGEEALSLFREQNYRLVLSDWDMPGMDGLTLCRRIRETTTSYVYFILVTSHSSANDLVTGLSAGADEFITKPFNPTELLARVRVGERLLAMETRDVALFSLAKLAESRDSDTGRHVERVREYARILARYMATLPKYRDRISDVFIRLIYETSPLHDIGKVGVPDSVLLKPGRLTDEEFAIMQTHTLIGKQTLDAALEKYPEAEFLRFARDIVASHHERYDGSGYPDGLAGDEIPLCARITAMADVYDALRSKRVYKDAYDHPTAREIIIKESGSHFDPDLVDAFIAVESELAAISEKLGDTPETLTTKELLCHA